MKTFQVTRPKDNAQAIATVTKSKTAQQGADIRFIAGGTTLIDLMKLNVEQPQNLVDVNRLTLDKIEAALRKIEKGVYGRCESCQKSAKGPLAHKRCGAGAPRGSPALGSHPQSERLAVRLRLGVLTC